MKALLVIGTFLFGIVAFAGPGHGHHHGPVDPCKAIATKDLKVSSKEIGKCHVERFVRAGKIASSWRSALYDKSITKQFKGRTEWVVTFNNQKGKKGKTLYIFLKENGGFIAANFSGK